MSSEIAALMAASDGGDRSASEALFSQLYAELRSMAKRELARHGGNISLGASTLLHQAYLDMAGRSNVSFVDQGRFMAYACRVMRGLIIDHARNRQAQKRGGRFEITAFTTEMAGSAVDHGELEQISEALDSLANVEPALAEIVDLKFFCGFSFAEIGVIQGLSERTVQRKWAKARIYLHRKLRKELPQ